MNDEQQTVVTDAPEDLDKLLNEFDESTKPAQPTADTSNFVTKEEFEAVKQDLVKARSDTAVKETVNSFVQRAEIPEDAANIYLHGLASTNPRFQKAFAERESDPENWNKILDSAVADYKKTFGGTPAADVDEAKDAVRAAATVQSDTAPADDSRSEAEKARAMTNEDYNAELRKMGL